MVSADTVPAEPKYVLPVHNPLPPAQRALATLLERWKSTEHVNGQDAFQGCGNRKRRYLGRRGNEEVNVFGHHLDCKNLPAEACADFPRPLVDKRLDISNQNRVPILGHENGVVA